MRHRAHPLFQGPADASPCPISFLRVEAHAEEIRDAAADLAAFATASSAAGAGCGGADE